MQDVLKLNATPPIRQLVHLVIQFIYTALHIEEDIIYVKIRIIRGMIGAHCTDSNTYVLEVYEIMLVNHIMMTYISYSPSTQVVYFCFHFLVLVIFMISFMICILSNDKEHSKVFMLHYHDKHTLYYYNSYFYITISIDVNDS